jgi:hypothetical protein
MEPCVGLRRKCSFWIFVKLLEKIYKDNNNFELKISRKCFIAHFCEKNKNAFCFNPSNNLVSQGPKGPLGPRGRGGVGGSRCFAIAFGRFETG